jgi:subtilisin family serine protease
MRTFYDPLAGIARSAISYLVLSAIVFIGIPGATTAQKPDGSDNSQMSGEMIRPVQNANAKMNKMSAENFAQAKAMAAGDKLAMPSVKAAAGGQPTTYYVMNVEFKTAIARRLVFTDLKQSKLPGAYVLTVIDRFADVFVDRDSAWDALLANPNVVKVEQTSTVEAPPPPEAVEPKLASQAVAERIVRSGYHGLTGKNVIIAVLDTGIDFRHPDFITYDAAGLPTSRIAYLWDTATQFQQGRGSTAPFKFPNGTSIGTLYSRAQLTSELRSKTVTIPPTDLDGHGTACASVAAGNGNADKMATGLKRPDVIGVAPEADIIGVRLGYDGLENSYLLNAICEWLDKVAGKTPLVVSGSFGGHYSGHDGQRIEERELNTRFPLTKAGRAVVFAAGNEGNDAIHAKVVFSKPAKLVTWNANEAMRVKLYFDSADAGITVHGTKATPVVGVSRSEINPITRQLEVRVDVEKGFGALWLENTSGKTTEAHLYIMDSQYGTFAPEYAVMSHLVGSPGAMENAITVGSYDWNDNFHSGGKTINLTSVCVDNAGARMPLEIGWLSCYSSPGPSRSGVVKPDIAAPGEWYPSANAKQGGRSAGTWARADSTGFYRAMNGTSAATPYTSGIIALMFQKKPLLTLGQVKTLLKANVTKTGLNPYNTGIPNNNWGYGKLDQAAIDRIFAAF